MRPPRLEAHVGGEVLRGVTAARAERRPLHLLRPSARSTSPKGSRSTTASIGGVMLERAAPSTSPPSPPACSPIACAWPTTSASAPSPPPTRCASSRPTGAPWRCRSTATTSATPPRPSSASGPGRSRSSLEPPTGSSSSAAVASRASTASSGGWPTATTTSRPSCARRPSRCRRCPPCAPASSSASGSTIATSRWRARRTAARPSTSPGCRDPRRVRPGRRRTWPAARSRRATRWRPPPCRGRRGPSTTTARASTRSGSRCAWSRAGRSRATSTPTHPLQRAMADAVADALGVEAPAQAVDGCGMLTFHAPLAALARRVRAPGRRRSRRGGDARRRRHARAPGPRRLRGRDRHRAHGAPCR